MESFLKKKGNIVFRFENKFFTIYNLKYLEKSKCYKCYKHFALFWLEKLIFDKILVFVSLCQIRTDFDYSAFISVVNKRKCGRVMKVKCVVGLNIMRN